MFVGKVGPALADQRQGGIEELTPAHNHRVAARLVITAGPRGRRVERIGAIERVVEAAPAGIGGVEQKARSEEHTSELQSLMRTSYAVFCMKKIKENKTTKHAY